MITACDVRFASADAFFCVKVRNTCVWLEGVALTFVCVCVRECVCVRVCVGACGRGLCALRCVTASAAAAVAQEVDIGLAADVGTLQRLPKVVGNDRCGS